MKLSSKMSTISRHYLVKRTVCIVGRGMAGRVIRHKRRAKEITETDR